MKIKGAGFFEAFIDVYEPPDITVLNTVIFTFTFVKASEPQVYLLIYLFNDAVSTVGGI